jgi:hypothetical protein
VLAVPGVFSLALAKLRADHEAWLPKYMGG